MNQKEIIDFLWNDYHPLTRVELGIKYFPEKKFWELTQSNIEKIVTTENKIS